MRDPNRMEPVLEKILEIWRRYPDLRFMQLIDWIQSRASDDMYYTEDNELIKILEGMKI